MARKRGKKKNLKGSRKKFAKVARAANATCHRTTNSVDKFRSCMRTEMRAGLKKEGFKLKRGG